MAKLEVKLILTLNDGSVHSVENLNTFPDTDDGDEDATDQYWALLKGSALASEEDERGTREQRKAKRNADKGKGKK